jgi:hypothetical protein
MAGPTMEYIRGGVLYAVRADSYVTLELKKDW